MCMWGEQNCKWTHVLFHCPRHNEARELLKQAAEASGQRWSVVEAGLVSNANLSREIRNFAKTVLTTKSRTQKRCAVDMTQQ